MRYFILLLFVPSFGCVCYTHCAILSRFSPVQLFATLQTAAHQAPLSMGFSRQEYWSGLPFPSLGDLPDPGIEPRSPTLQVDYLSSESRILEWVAYPFSLKISFYFKIAHGEGASQVALVVKNLPVNAGDLRDGSTIPGSGRSPWRREWQPTPVFLPGESHGQRSLAGYSLQGCKESDTVELLTPSLLRPGNQQGSTESHQPSVLGYGYTGL